MSKQVTRQVAATRAVASVPGRVYVLIPGMRPKSGERLLAHTAAALEVLGLLRGKTAPVTRVQAIIGHTAVSYHTQKLHTMEVTGTTLRVTPAGKEMFAAREKENLVSRSLIDAFKAVFTTGKANEEAQVKAHHIAAEQA